MLDVMSARMLSEWIAFERFDGPLDQHWRDEVLAQIHEAIQLNSELVGASIPRKKGKKNPAPKFRKVPRPWTLFKKDQDVEEEDEEDEEE